MPTARGICYTTYMFSALESALIGYIDAVPLEVFVFVASIVEEVIAPIPSPTVMVLSGTFAQAQEYALMSLIPLAIIGAIGKTLGALTVYAISHKVEHIFVGKFGKFFNVSHSDIAAFGSKLTGGMRDYVLLTFLRALPIMPSVVMSVGGGVLKIPLPLFIVSTFFGTIIRDGFYLYAGYVGAKAFVAIISQSTHVETVIEVGIALCILGFVLYKKFYTKRIK